MIRLNRIKLFGIIILVFISNVLPVYGGEGDKRGVLDELAGDAKAKRFEREAIGSKGHYYVNGSYYGLEEPISGWIEDEEGNDLFLPECSAVVDKNLEIYSVVKNGEYFLNSDLKPITNEILSTRADAGYCIRFDGFDILAVIDSENKRSDPADTEHTVYFDTEGNEISDVCQYISDRGEKPEKGIYYDSYYTFRDRSFTKKQAVVGVADLYATAESEVFPRMRIGDTGHYLCGGDVDKTGVGSWIEDEDGLDIYYEDRRDTGTTSIYALDTTEEQYYVVRTFYHGVDEGIRFILNGNMETIVRGIGSDTDILREYGYIKPDNYTDKSDDSAEMPLHSALEWTLTVCGIFTAVYILIMGKMLIKK